MDWLFKKASFNMLCKKSEREKESEREAEKSDNF